jgi:hypothetical protein
VVLFLVFVQSQSASKGLFGHLSIRARQSLAEKDANRMTQTTVSAIISAFCFAKEPS